VVVHYWKQKIIHKKRIKINNSYYFSLCYRNKVKEKEKREIEHKKMIVLPLLIVIGGL
jgi:hypothetical protein